MSLRARVVALIGMVLLLATLVGALVAGSQSRMALQAELTSGLAGGRGTVLAALEDLTHSDHPDRDINQLVDTFNGNRHVRARLLDADGRVLRTSSTESADHPAPAWFQRLLGAEPPSVIVPLPSGAGRIELAPIPELDAAVAWRQFVGVLIVLAALTAAGVGLVYLVIGAALKPLTQLAGQFDRIGQGDYSGRIAESGPPELLRLERGFNRMATELGTATERNRLLTDQLLTLQEEERAEIARDLHDEFGPHLFAINIDAEMIVTLGRSGQTAAVEGQARLIQGAVGHMQRQVRDLLGRLRPTRVTELGLNAAIEDLVRFWGVRRPGMTLAFTPLADEDRLPEPSKDVVYRVVQEATANAVRHGDPSAVTVRLSLDPEGGLEVVVADNGRGATASSGPGGLGLMGMRERVAGMGGELTFGPDPQGGWTTRARLPVAAVARGAEAAA